MLITALRSAADLHRQSVNGLPMLLYMLAKKGFHYIAYLDDFSGCESTCAEAEAAFNCFISLAADLGLQLSPKKCIAPSTNIEWLGYQINTIDMTIAIPPGKMAEIRKECQQWYLHRKVNKTMVQSTVGKLIFVANCVTHARKFVACRFNTLRGMKDDSWVTV